MDKSSIPPRTLVPAVARIFPFAVLMVLLPAPAAGDELDTLTLVFSTSLSRDANVFRRPDSSPPPTGFSNRSDLIGVVAAGVHIDKPYGQQRFQLEATGTYTRYNTFSFLDFGTFEYRGAWLWQLTPRLGGVLSAERKQSLVPFADFQGFERNLSTTDSRDFHLDGWVFGGWHLLAGASQSESRTDVQFQADGSSRITAGEAGVRYVAGSGSALTVTRRSGHGDYLDRAVNAATYIDNGYRQDETELSAAWYLSGKSTLNARLTYIERSHEHFSQRNFSGTLGQLDYTWTPTGKLRLAFSAKRDIGSWWDQGSATASSSYRVTDSLAFAPAWQVDAKVAVRARFEHARIDYRGPVGADFRPARGDTLRGAQVAVDWFPMRYLSVSFSVERDSRASNNPMYEFGDTISGLSVLMKF